VANHLIERLVWDDQLRRWEGDVTFPSGRIVDVAIDLPDEQSYDSPETQETFNGVQAASRPFLLWFLEQEKELYDIVAAEMVILYNDAWTDEPEITAEEFASRIEMVHLSFQTDKKSFILSFSDGEMKMFGGHLIDASFNEEGRLEDCNLIG